MNYLISRQFGKNLAKDSQSRQFLVKKFKSNSLKSLKEIRNRNLNLPKYLVDQERQFDMQDQIKYKKMLEETSMNDVTNPFIQQDCWLQFNYTEDFTDLRKYPNGYMFLSPNELKKRFGPPKQPSSQQLFHLCSGEYVFADTNLDYFIIYEYRSIINSHRILSKMNTSQEEFWNRDEPQKFYIKSTRYADIESFKLRINDFMKTSKDKFSNLDIAQIQTEIEDNYFEDYTNDYSQMKNRDIQDPIVEEQKKFIIQSTNHE